MPLRKGSYSIQVPYKLKGEDDLCAHAAFVCSKSILPRMDIATVQKFFALAANPANHPGAKKMINSPLKEEESKEPLADSDDEVAAPSPKATIPLHFNCKQALLRELGVMNLVEVHQGKNCIMCHDLPEVERLTAVLTKRGVRAILMVDKEEMRDLKYRDTDRKKRFQAVHGKNRDAKGASLKRKNFSYKLEQPAKDSLARVRTI